MRIDARHYATGEALSLTIDAGRITSVSRGDREPDAPLSWLAPSLFDLQLNGALGVAFNSATLTADEVQLVAKKCREHGIGGLCPTLITASFDELTHGFTTLRQLCEADPNLAKRLPGFHLEGPYISAEDGPRGAHPLPQVRKPDWDEFQALQEAAGGRIRLVTLAPEHDGAMAFIERLVASGVVVAIGHTAARGEQIREAVRAGVRLSTHLGNGAHAILPRHPNYIWEQLADDGLWASVIADGHHLPASVVKCIVRVKTPARVVLTSDASSLAGSPPGRYQAWGQDLEVTASGRVGVAGTPFLAGSGVFTDVCVCEVMKMAGVSLAEAIDMAALRPRELLGLPIPRIEEGADADLMLFDWEPGESIRVREVIGS